MITRLKVNGFKNLIGVDIYFGAFNVVAGLNGVGKSNVFDVLQFLSNLTSMNIKDAARKIRGVENNLKAMFSDDFDGVIDIEVWFKGEINLNYGTGETEPDIQDCEMEYLLKLKWDEGIKKVEETTRWLNRDDGQPKRSLWMGSQNLDNEFSQLSQYRWYYDEKDGESSDATPENLLIRGDVKSIRVFSLNPDRLRDFSPIDKVGWIEENGSNLPGFLQWISTQDEAESLKDNLSRYLFYLNEDIYSIKPQLSEGPEIIWLDIRNKFNMSINTTSLSDGTLRMIALVAIFVFSSQYGGIVLVEEPENGINISKIENLVRLMTKCVEKSNPRFQLIVNSHSPAVVSETSDSSIIFAKLITAATSERKQFRKPRFCGMRGTWREKAGMPAASISELADFIDPIPPRFEDDPLRLIDREDAQRLLERRRQVKVLTSEDA